jgi:hypothetical protein
LTRAGGINERRDERSVLAAMVAMESREGQEPA